MADQEPEKIPFETRLQHVQDIIQRIEGNTLSLEDSVTEFERGMKILNSLETELGDLNRKITVLRSGRDGIPEEEPQGGNYADL